MSSRSVGVVHVAVVAFAMLALAVSVGGCGSDNNPTIVIGPTATASSAPSTPTATPATSPTITVSVTPTPTLAGPTATPTSAAPLALWVENSGSATVSEFGGSTLTTPGPSLPPALVQNKSPDLSPDTSGISFDGSGRQWVSVCGNKTGNHGSIAGFNAALIANLKAVPAPPASVVISDDGTGKLINCPWATTFDKAGNMWVANSSEMTAPPGFVTAYQSSQLSASGHPTPFVTLTDPTEFISPTDVLFDATGNLFVSDFGPQQFGTAGSGKIWVFTGLNISSQGPGNIVMLSIQSNANLSDPSTVTPVSSGFDKSGNLWTADCEANKTGEIYMFPKASLTTTTARASAIFQSGPIATVNGVENTLNCPGGIAFDAAGNLWYTNFFSAQTAKGVAGAVGEFTAAQLAGATGTSTPVPNIFLEGDTTGTNFDAPIGLRFGPQS
jgi:hypothetical protein